MNEKINFSTIVRDYLDGHISEDVRNRIIQYFYQQDENQSDEIYELIADQIDSLNPEELDAFYLKLRQHSGKDHVPSVVPIKRKYIQKRRLSVAAAIIALCSIGGYFLSGYLPFLNEVTNNETLKLIEVTTGNKETLLVHLPDGSEVNLNAASTLRYSAEFNAKERTVYLDGEAFFNIEPNKERPFIVHVQDGIYTKVLGTSFNVRTYKDLKEIKIGVATGKVEVGKQNSEKRDVFEIVIPNQEIVYQRKDGLYSVQKALDVSSWMDGKLVFIKNSLEEVISEVNRKYDVAFVLDSSVPADLKCTATFSMDQSPLEIINALCKLHNLKYESQSNAIILQSN